MSLRLSGFPLLAVLLLPLPLQAQQTPAPDPQLPTAEQDIGTLQAELAKVEAERQRLADELANAADHAEVERLGRQNIALRDRLAAMEEAARQNQQEQQRKWFMIGGATVAGSVLLGWILAQLGGRRKRSEWLN